MAIEHRQALTPSRVVDEAGRLADEVGFDHLTLAGLAARLGVKLPSLYKHVDGIDDVRGGMAASAKSELADVMAAAAVGRARGDAVRALAVAYRDWAVRHPGRYAATVRAPRAGDTADQEAALRATRVALDVLRGYGLDGDDAIDVARALRAGLHGFISLEAAGGFGLPVDVERSFTRMVDSFVVGLESRPGRTVQS